MNKLNIASMVVLGLATTGAFMTRSRKEIRERAGNRSELSSKNNRPLQCAHLNHYMSNDRLPEYHDPSNGLLVTDIEHLAHHLYWRELPRELGLSKAGNEAAIQLLRDSITAINAKIEYPYTQFLRDLEDAKLLWDRYYIQEI